MMSGLTPGSGPFRGGDSRNRAIGPGEIDWEDAASASPVPHALMVSRLRRRSTYMSILFAALSAFALAGLIIYDGLQNRDELINSEKTALAYRAQMTGRQLGSDFSALTMVLTDVAEQASHNLGFLKAENSPAPEVVFDAVRQVMRYIDQEVRQVPLVTGIGIFDADGNRVMASRRFPDTARHADDLAAGNLVAHRDDWRVFGFFPPDLSQPPRRRFMVVSRGILSDSGEFLGIVQALVNAQEIMGPDGEIDTGRLDNMVLFDSNNRVLAVCNCPMVTRDFAPGIGIRDVQPFEQLSLDGIEAHGTDVQLTADWLLSVYQMRDFPIRLALARARSGIAADWWEQNRASFFTAFGILVLTSAFVFLLLLRLRKQMILENRNTEHARILRYQNALLGAMRDSTPDGVLMVDQDWRIRLWNQRFIDLAGVPRELVMSGDDRKLLAHFTSLVAEPEEFSRLVMHYMGHPEEQEHNTEVRMRAGRVLERSSIGVGDDEFGFWGRIWFFRDVTEARRTEQNVTQLGRVLDRSANEVYLISPETLKIRKANATALDRLGYSPDEISMLAITDIDDTCKAVDYQNYLDALKKGEKRLFFQARFRCQDGNRYPVDVTLQYMEQETPPVLLAIALDATEKRRAAEALASQSAFQETLLDTVPLPVLAMEGNSEQINAMNQAFENLFGFSRESTISEAARLVFPAALYELVCRENERLLASGGSLFYAGDVPRADGQLINLLIFKAAYRDPHGRPAGIVGVMLDQTDQQELQGRLENTVRELADSNRELEQFAYVASHDLQEPLRMVTNYVRLLERRLGDSLDEDSRDFINFAADGAQRMQALIRDLLNYSRVTTKGRDLVACSSRECLDAALTNLDLAIQESGAEIDIGRLPVVLVDAPQFIRLLQNIIGNALKYCHPGRAPRIRVTAEKDPEKAGFWLFHIQDNGIGFEQDQAERIFLIFQRLQTRGEYEGTGIGLAICRRVVERHGGTIWATGRPGEGSCFHFTLKAPQSGDSDSSES